MTEQKAFEVLYEHTQHFIPVEDLGALEVAMESLRKHIPKAPVEIQELCDVEWLCPNCKSKVGDIVNVDNYCKECGQKILFNN